MQIQKQGSHYFGIVLFSFVLISVGVGCASTHKTTKTETTVTYPNKGVVYQAGPKTTTVSTAGDQENAGVVETSTTTTTETKTAEHSGILSSTLHAVGYVIALPFIIVGNLLKAIF